MMQKIAITVLSALGFAVSCYIRHHRVNNKELVCSLKTKCNVVVGSKYNKLLGIHNDVLGMLYYGIFALIFLASLKYQFMEYGYVNLFILISSGFAAMFSAYLILAQIFKLKEYCQWCLASTTISIGTFIILLA